MASRPTDKRQSLVEAVESVALMADTDAIGATATARVRGPSLGGT